MAGLSLPKLHGAEEISPVLRLARKLRAALRATDKNHRSGHVYETHVISQLLSRSADFPPNMMLPRADHFGRELLMDIDAEAGTQSIYLDGREIDALVNVGGPSAGRLVCDFKVSAPGGVFSRLFDHYLHDRYEQGGASALAGFACVSDTTEQAMWRAALATFRAILNENGGNLLPTTSQALVPRRFVAALQRDFGVRYEKPYGATIVGADALFKRYQPEPQKLFQQLRDMPDVRLDVRVVRVRERSEAEVLQTIIKLLDAALANIAETTDIGWALKKELDAELQALRQLS